jgi:hypothetical protein
MCGLLPVGYQDKAKDNIEINVLAHHFILISIYWKNHSYASLNLLSTSWPYRFTRVGGYDNAQIPSCGILFVVGTISPRLARRLFRLRANPGMLG